ncbi:hypothetical protein [Haploplasma axanthum]|uniref:Uncharacterized protein n=1 Tax=Haploplasma axanthum TaxID=29552 RepID=A0A449BEJ6_HAPAX|nr:hypothetical protein [Haploplasma axanthum]VEU80730.1 Uncharacterised protein [Haploplasma axanthum]
MKNYVFIVLGIVIGIVALLSVIYFYVYRILINRQFKYKRRYRLMRPIHAVYLFFIIFSLSGFSYIAFSGPSNLFQNKSLNYKIYDKDDVAVSDIMKLYSENIQEKSVIPGYEMVYEEFEDLSVLIYVEESGDNFEFLSFLIFTEYTAESHGDKVRIEIFYEEKESYFNDDDVVNDYSDIFIIKGYISEELNAYLVYGIYEEIDGQYLQVTEIVLPIQIRFE